MQDMFVFATGTAVSAAVALAGDVLAGRVIPAPVADATQPVVADIPAARTDLSVTDAKGIKYHTAASLANAKHPKAWQHEAVSAGIPPIMGETHKAYITRTGHIAEQQKQVATANAESKTRRGHYDAEAYATVQVEKHHNNKGEVWYTIPNSDKRYTREHTARFAAANMSK